MTVLRRRLRVWTMAWLVLQGASLSAVVPRMCCATPRPERERMSCHRPTSAVHCPMRAAGGAPCPMHRSADDAASRQSEACSLRGTCSEPMAALFTILSGHGVLPDLSSIPADSDDGVAAPLLRENPTSRLAAPDPPPPRA